MDRLLMLIMILVLLGSCKQDLKENKEEEATAIQNVAEQVNVVKPVPEAVKIELPSIDQVMGKFNPVQDTNFVKIDAKYTDKPAIYLQKEAYSQFLKMHQAAASEGVELFILSATRPFNYQKNIWERKWAKLQAAGRTDEKEMVREILLYSAMPGTSRHHWGTDIDLNYLNNQYFESGKGQKIYDWMIQHAAEYGFCQPYTIKGENRPNGYEEEKWHWSYIPMAERYFKVAREKLNNDMISGFSGASHAKELQVVEKFVLGIDPKCF